MWAFILSIPVFIIVCLTKNPQVIVTYTGGICGTFILFIFPVTLFFYSQQRQQADDRENPNKSAFQNKAWGIGIYVFSTVTIFSVLWGAFHGNGGE